MNIIKTNIDGVLIIEPKIFKDSRGYFFESFSEQLFVETLYPILGLDYNKCNRSFFVLDNESMSSFGVMRGLHFLKPPFALSKLVRCVKGSVLDIALDIRKGSPTYGNHVSVELTEDNHRLFFIPRGFAHGFVVLSDSAIFLYKCDNYYAPQADGGVFINDDSLGIDFGINIDNIILSEKDKNQQLFKNFDSPFSMDSDLYPEFSK